MITIITLYHFLSMSKKQIWVIAILLLLIGCNQQETATTTPSFPSPPATIPITNDAEETVAEQPEGFWVMISGVDEHGLIAEHDLNLYAEPNPDQEVIGVIHTGTAVVPHEIRQTGPQGLRRFYHIQTIDGQMGWISDYYIRRVAYLFNENGTTVSLYAAPGERQVGQVPNVTPIKVKDPTQMDWWIVQTIDGKMLGWVEATFVKESSEPEFLLNEQHLHEP